MANESISAPVSTPAPALVTAAPVTPSPAVVEVVQPAPVVEAPVIAPAVESAPAPAVAPVEAPKAPETVLGEGLEKNKPVEAPKVEGEAPKVEIKEEGQSAEPAPPPVYDTFTVPEGITLDTERVSEFTKILSKLELDGKLDHALAQKSGQELVDFHIQEVKKATEDLTKMYQTAWDRQKIEWKDTFLKDPEIGGNRFQTTVDSALNFIRTHGGTPEQQTEFKNLMETSGLGNHPAVIRLLANAGSAMAEGKPIAATRPVPQAKSKIETMYGST